VKILKSIKEAAGAGGELVLVEAVIAPPGTEHPHGPAQKTLDTLMMCIGGKERSQDEWIALLADGGWKLDKVRREGECDVVRSVACLWWCRRPISSANYPLGSAVVIRLSASNSLTHRRRRRDEKGSVRWEGSVCAVCVRGGVRPHCPMPHARTRVGGVGAKNRFPAR